jgi:hypothetical protein
MRTPPDESAALTNAPPMTAQAAKAPPVENPVIAGALTR